MMKTPFQFGLKSVFKAITAVAALLAIRIAAPELVSLLAGIAALPLSMVLFSVLCNKFAIYLMESAPRRRPDA